MATIQGIYLALFGRPADPAGLAFFNAATNNGANLSAIGNLSSTTEFQARFGGLSNQDIINAIYRSLFERDGEAEGIQFYLRALEAGSLTINTVAIAILDGARGSDLAMVNAKIAAANLFTSHLDQSFEITAYSGTSAAAIGRAFIDGITVDNPGTDANVDAAILSLTAGQGQEPGGGGGGSSPPDTTPPVGTVDPSSSGDGTFKAGEVITFTVNFSENVIISNDATLALSHGGEASYASGSGSSTATFTYTVPAATTEADLEVTGIGAGSIADAAGNAGTVTATTALDIEIDTSAPTGTVTAAGDGTFGAGETITFAVTFGEDVEVSPGTALTLTGGRQATFVSGDGTNTLTFSYVVQATESAPDLEVTGINGAIADIAGNAASLDLSTDLDLVILPPDGQIHVYNAAGTLTAIYSTQPNPGGDPLWHQNAYPINAAVNGAGAGFTVMVGSGSYTTGGSPITITQDGLKLLGAQMNVDTSTSAALRSEGGGDESIINSAGLGAIKIQADNVEVNGFVMTGATSSGIDLVVTDGAGGNSGARIAYNIVHNAADDGIVIYDHDGAVVEHNRIFNTQDGVTVHGGSNNTTVTNNEMHGGKSDGHGGVYTYQSTNTHITDNLIYDYQRSGIMFGVRNGTENDAASGGTVVGNTVRDVGHTGISIFQSDVTVSGNTVSEAAYYAISVGDNGYEGNKENVNNVDILNNIVFDNNNNTTKGYTGPFHVRVGTDIVFTNNQISGGAGTDTMAATSGSDTFVIRTLTEGVDTIQNFQKGPDKLDLRAVVISFADLDTNSDDVLDAADTAISVSGGNLTIVLATGPGGSTVVLTGVSTLTETDFL